MLSTSRGPIHAVCSNRPAQPTIQSRSSARAQAKLLRVLQSGRSAASGRARQANRRANRRLERLVVRAAARGRLDHLRWRRWCRFDPRAAGRLEDVPILTHVPRRRATETGSAQPGPDALARSPIRVARQRAGTERDRRSQLVPTCGRVTARLVSQVMPTCPPSSRLDDIQSLEAARRISSAACRGDDTGTRKEACGREPMTQQACVRGSLGEDADPPGCLIRRWAITASGMFVRVAPTCDDVPCCWAWRARLAR